MLLKKALFFILIGFNVICHAIKHGARRRLHTDYLIITILYRDRREAGSAVFLHNGAGGQV
jgi:hypothetical protein